MAIVITVLFACSDEAPLPGLGDEDAARGDVQPGADGAQVDATSDGDDGGAGPDGAFGLDASTMDGGVADSGEATDAAGGDALGPDAMTADAGEPDAASADAASTPDGGRPFRVVTFSSGTSGGSQHDLPPDDGYGSAEAQICDEWYGNGLSWNDVIDDARGFFAGLAADVVVFQEIFHPADCASIPAQYHPGFICESWSMGDPTVAQEVLGPGWQIACNLGKPDKCAAVRRSFGSFRGCAADLCLDGLEGGGVMGCGSGSRIGRGTIDLVGGGTITVVNVHGSSGILQSDQDCRVLQFEQVFVDLGDGQPAANGARNVVLGDFNTDPARNAWFDDSADRLNDFVGPNEPFYFLSPVGVGAPPTYSGLFNIDHVISDVFTGSCFVPGVTQGHPEVSDIDFFDHKPVVCDLAGP